MTRMMLPAGGFVTPPALAPGASALPQPCSTPPPAADETRSELQEHGLAGLDETEQRCWQHFLNTSARLLETLHRKLVDEHQLALYDFLVLDLLARSPGGSARMRDLAHELVLRPSRVTQQISRLESQGLVQRRRSTNDGRGVVASITREGRARVRPAAKTYAQAVRELYLGPVSRREMIVLGDSCRRIGAPLKSPNPRRSIHAQQSDMRYQRGT